MTGCGSRTPGCVSDFSPNNSLLHAFPRAVLLLLLVILLLLFFLNLLNRKLQTSFLLTAEAEASPPTSDSQTASWGPRGGPWMWGWGQQLVFLKGQSSRNYARHPACGQSSSFFCVSLRHRGLLGAAQACWTREGCRPEKVCVSTGPQRTRVTCARSINSACSLDGGGADGLVSTKFSKYSKKPASGGPLLPSLAIFLCRGPGFSPRCDSKWCRLPRTQQNVDVSPPPPHGGMRGEEHGPGFDSEGERRLGRRDSKGG